MVYHKTRIFKNGALYMGGLFTLDAVNDQIDLLNLSSDGNEENYLVYVNGNTKMLVEATPAKISERV